MTDGSRTGTDLLGIGVRVLFVVAVALGAFHLWISLTFRNSPELQTGARSDMTDITIAAEAIDPPEDRPGDRPRETEESEFLRGPVPPLTNISIAAEGFAVDLGSASSFSELSGRFASIAENNAELAFDRYEPRATLVDTESGPQARLLVGPFDTLEAARRVCRNIALPEGVTCRPAGFRGEHISRR